VPGLSEERDRIKGGLKARGKQDGTNEAPATGAATAVVEVIAQDRRAVIHMADGNRRPKGCVTEVMMLQCCAVTGENFMVTAEIVRSGPRPLPKPWERMENRESVGRFIFDVVPLVEWQ
jgi:hypothetical protein